MARDGFLQLLRAEWTKLRTVRRWVIALVSAVGLTVLLSLLAAAGSGTDSNTHKPFVVSFDNQPVADDFHFYHQAMTGDATIIARVVSQQDSHEWASAGVMVKESVQSGSRYAAVMLTPKHGVRFQANFSVDRAGGDQRWLRLSRSGATVTGFESADGITWRDIGSVRLDRLGQSAQIGLFVSSPPKVRIERQAGSTSVGSSPTCGTAVFDNVRVEPSTAAWAGESIGRDEFKTKNCDQTEEAGDALTLTGSGKIGPDAPDDDIVQIGLFGVLAGVIVLISLGVIFATSEFKRGLIRTTFTASPRRGRVLAAKAVVFGSVAFLIGLLASVSAFLVSQPLLRDHGFTAPAFPPQSLFDTPVLRALLTTSVFMAAVAIFSLALGVILRHGAAAITAAIILVVAPTIVSTALPITASRWLMRLTPAGGFATQRVKPPTDGLAEAYSAISPWSGLGAVCVYAAAAMVLAWWLLRRRGA